MYSQDSKIILQTLVKKIKIEFIDRVTPLLQILSIHCFLSNFLSVHDETGNNALKPGSAFQEVYRVIGIGKNAPGSIGSPAQVCEESLLDMDGSIWVLISRHL